MPSLIALGKVASTKPFFLAHRYRSARAVRFVYTQTFSLRPSGASDRRNIRHLFSDKAHFRVGAGSPSADRYRSARFGECAFSSENLSALLRILLYNSVCFPHKADAHVGDVTR